MIYTKTACVLSIEVRERMIILHDEYEGIDSDEEDRIVTINQKRYFATTYNIPRFPSGEIIEVKITFHNVTFTFPTGDFPTNPSIGTYVNTILTFPDGIEEPFATEEKLPDTSSNSSCLYAPARISGTKSATTVLSSHTNPQAGVTAYKGRKIKLLVSVG